MRDTFDRPWCSATDGELVVLAQDYRREMISAARVGNETRRRFAADDLATVKEEIAIREGEGRCDG